MMAKKQALGKGLNALLPALGDPDADDALVQDAVSIDESDRPKPRLYQFEDKVRLLGRITELPVENVKPNPFQPRLEFNEQALDELAASISELGIIQPITVRALGENRFELISGERRLRAAKRAGLKRVPAFVREADTEAMLEMAIVENVQREDLNPVEVAIGYQRLIDECGLTQDDVARKVGKNRTTVTNTLRLLRLPPRVQASLRDRSITAGHARALVNLPDTDAQYRVLDRILQDNLTVRDVETLGRVLTEKPPAPPKPASRPPAELAKPDPNTPQLEAFTDELRTRFSTRVHIKHRSDGSGRIEIEYYSQGDLERLLESLLDRSF